MNIALPLLLGIWHGDIIGTLCCWLVCCASWSTTMSLSSSTLWRITGVLRPYTESNSARDNGFLAFLTYGEGYHNYHHIFQTGLPQRHSLVAVGSHQVADQRLLAARPGQDSGPRAGLQNPACYPGHPVPARTRPTGSCPAARTHCAPR